jgi:hypothetical protein
MNRRNLMGCMAFWILPLMSSGSIAADLKITVTDPTTGKTVAEYEKSYTPDERARFREGNEQARENEQKGERLGDLEAGWLARDMERFNAHFDAYPGFTGRLSNGDLQGLVERILCESDLQKGVGAERRKADLLASIRERVDAHSHASPGSKARLSGTELDLLTAMILYLSGAPIPPSVPDAVPPKTVNVTPNPVPKVPDAPRGAVDVTTGQYYPPAAGGVTDPNTGTFYQDVGPGYVNSRTGEFSPKIGGH